MVRDWITIRNFSPSVSTRFLTNNVLLAQRKVEYENFRFKHPQLLAVVIESINQQVIETQRTIGRFFFRFHVSDDITIGELSEIMKFKINGKISNPIDRLTTKERVVFFN